ncbi:hypothetical protein GQ42DRAFT_81536 [Ramicandelaber brevisporus]|nr:hypothetical protein GQ42DRAFT_81536 [Ramicandelaber brevisporus]
MHEYCCASISVSDTSCVQGKASSVIATIAIATACCLHFKRIVVLNTCFGILRAFSLFVSLSSSLLLSLQFVQLNSKSFFFFPRFLPLFLQVLNTLFPALQLELIKIAKQIHLVCYFVYLHSQWSIGSSKLLFATIFFYCRYGERECVCVRPCLSVCDKFLLAHRSFAVVVVVVAGWGRLFFLFFFLLSLSLFSRSLIRFDPVLSVKVR